jgi:hypothetical protein
MMFMCAKLRFFVLSILFRGWKSSFIQRFFSFLSLCPLFCLYQMTFLFVRKSQFFTFYLICFYSSKKRYTFAAVIISIKVNIIVYAQGCIINSIVHL